MQIISPLFSIFFILLINIFADNKILTKIFKFLENIQIPSENFTKYKRNIEHIQLFLHIWYVYLSYWCPIEQNSNFWDFELWRALRKV